MKIGVVGLGDIAEVAYLENLHRPRAGFEVKYLCDLKNDRREWAAGLIPSATATKDFDEILRDESVNWVFVLTPLLAHAALIRRALQAGKNVYTEKPMSVDFAEATELVELSKAKRVHFASAPIMLLYPVYEYVRRLLLGGALGQLTAARALMAHGGPNTWEFKSDPSWYFKKNMASELPPLPDLAIYCFSYLTHLFGPARTVSAMATLVVKERRFDKVTAPGFEPYTLKPRGIKDNCIVNIEYGNGVLASVTANFASGGHWPDSFEIYGTEGTLTMPYRCGHVNIQSNLPPHNRPAGLHSLNLRGKTGGRAFAGVNWGPIVARHLQRSVEMGAEPLIGRQFSLHVVEIITAAMEAARTGHTQRLTTRFRHSKAWGV